MASGNSSKPYEDLRKITEINQYEQLDNKNTRKDTNNANQYVNTPNAAKNVYASIYTADRKQEENYRSSNAYTGLNDAYMQPLDVAHGVGSFQANPNPHIAHSGVGNPYYNNAECKNDDDIGKNRGNEYYNKTGIGKNVFPLRNISGSASRRSAYTKENDDKDLYQDIADHSIENEYADIPADYFSRPKRHTSLSGQHSLSSTDSKRHILAQNKPKSSTCHINNRYAIMAVIVVIVLFLVTVAVAVGVTYALASDKAELDSDLPPTTITPSTNNTPPPNVATTTQSNVGPPNPPTTTQSNVGPPNPATTTQSNVGPSNSVTGSSDTTSTTRSDSGTTTTTISTPASTTASMSNSPENRLIIYEHPKAATAVIGDRVTLCCMAYGTPTPQTYEWFKDGVLIPQQTEANVNRSVLTISSVQSADTGQYSCKATNALGSVYSYDAQLEVRATNSFCDTTPWSWTTVLPTGCTYNGQSTFNPGHCPSKPCSAGGSVGCNTDQVTYCCAPVRFNTITVNCADRNVFVSVISECGCVECDEPYYDITGIAQSADGQTIFANPHIYFSEMHANVALDTNDRADTTGIFQITVHNNIKRMYILSENIYDRPSFYTLSSHILHLAPIVAGPVHFMVDVRYLPESNRAQYSTSQDLTKSVQFNDGSEFLDLVIPANHYFMENGSVFTGSYDLSVDAVKGSDMENLRAVAGDFMYIGSDGKQHYIFVHGVFAMEMRQGAENSLETILYKGDVEVTLSSNTFAFNDNPKLWRLGPMGFWHFESDVTPQGKATIAGIPSGYAWFAIAKPSTYNVCVTKIAVVDQVIGDSTEVGSFLTGAQIEISIQGVSGHTGGIYTKRANTDMADEYGYCIEHPCHESLSGKVMATYDHEQLTSTNGDTMISFSAQPSEDGPTFLASNSIDCTFPNHFIQDALVFQRVTCSKQLYSVEYPKSLSSTQPQCILDYYKSWHSPAEYINQDFKSCHIKVITDSGATTNVFRAVSYVGNLGTDFTEGEHIYGMHEDCTVNVNGIGVVCLEIKTGGTRNCNGNTDNAVTDSNTRIEIYPVSHQTSVMKIDASLVRKVNILKQDSEFHFTSVQFTYGRIYGVYCTDYNSPETARWNSKRKCLNGLDTVSGASSINANYFGVRFA